VGKPKGKRLEGPKCKGVDSIKMDHREIRWDCMDWLDLAQYRGKWRARLSTVINFRVP
jgi:hypothetical protein